MYRMPCLHHVRPYDPNLALIFILELVNSNVSPEVLSNVVHERPVDKIYIVELVIIGA
jgi:hypothetical protein